MMIISFPIGAYVVFNSNLGKEINFQYPLDGVDIFLGGIGFKLPVHFEIGDGFIVVWCVYLVLFAISLAGPQRSLVKALSLIMIEGWQNIKNNALLSMITWFSILIVFSLIIDFIQHNFGINIEPPASQNRLIQFFQVTTSPLSEEIGFRVLLIGLPLFAIFSHKASLKHFFKSLWHPSKNLEVTNYKKVIALIITVSIFFGAAHIISGAPWSTGKFAQATVAGIIIGWVYFRYGFAPAILIHWATNYFIFSYVYFISEMTQSPITGEFSDPFLNTLETLLLIAGGIAIVGITLNYIKSKKESTITQV
ncbi:MAG: CPBP family intramembrane metalloprotease [Thaumarchaeota archaeon]|nr:CPBP family intramembrane metalloprotease [Nitrososphaerota archaeon]MBI3641112.1 CPBP family intramembrane metalloprotease [Nitrososphaerota archaeon]